MSEFKKSKVGYHLRHRLTEKNPPQLPPRTLPNQSNTNKEEKKEEKKEEQEVLLTSPELPRKTKEWLNDDEKLWFCLDAIGSLQKNQKLTIRDQLLSVDDRKLFQGIRRWWSGDNRKLICEEIIAVVKAVQKRVQRLLDDDFKDRKKVVLFQDSFKTLEKKKQSERYEERKNKIRNYFLKLETAVKGIEMLRQTYSDNYSKTNLNLASLNISNSIELLKKTSYF